MCKHGMAVEEGVPLSETNWEAMQETVQFAVNAIVKAFPTVPILPVIGNNDVIYHDQAPDPTIKQQYYDTLW